MKSIENYLKLNKDCTLDQLFKAFNKIDSVLLVKELQSLVRAGKVVRTKKDDYNIYNLA